MDPRMRVEEALIEAMEVRLPHRQGSRRIMEAMELMLSVGLDGRALAKLPSQLSGGEQQRVALARALAVRPELLILDEPTSALDLLTQERILGLIKSLQSHFGLSLLCITHDVPMALAFCDRIALLEEGRIVEEGTCAQLVTAPRNASMRKLMRDCGITAPPGLPGRKTGR